MRTSKQQVWWHRCPCCRSARAIVRLDVKLPTVAWSTHSSDLLASTTRVEACSTFARSMSAPINTEPRTYCTMSPYLWESTMGCRFPTTSESANTHSGGIWQAQWPGQHKTACQELRRHRQEHRRGMVHTWLNARESSKNCPRNAPSRWGSTCPVTMTCGLASATM